MPLRGQRLGHRPHRATASAGRVAMRTELILRFDYGSIGPWVTPARRWRAARDRRARTWWSCARRCQLRGEDLTTVGDFDVTRGERVPFVLTYGASHLPPPEPIDPESALEDTEAFWRDWAARCTSRRRMARAPSCAR